MLSPHMLVQQTVAANNPDVFLSMLQVYKGIKNGVQDVAVKVLINSDDIQVKLFQEVRHGGKRLLGQSLLSVVLLPTFIQPWLYAQSWRVT